MNATTSKKMMIYVLKYPDARCTLPVLLSMQCFKNNKIPGKIDKIIELNVYSITNSNN